MIPSKRLSQVFLVDKNILNKIVNSIECSKGIPILEIGPGSGLLTQHLVASGFRVVAIEIDKGLFNHLTTKMQRYLQNNRLNIIMGDFLKLNIPKIAKDFNTKEFCIVSNIPYHITGPILEKICLDSILFRMVYLTVQWEVAQRIVATPGTRSYGTLSIMLQTTYIPTVLFRIKRTSFKPVPEVDSGFVKLIRRDKPIIPKERVRDFHLWTRKIFQYRRKTLRRVLIEMNCSGISNIDPDILKLRPEQMGIKDLFSVFGQVKCTTN